MGLFTMYPTTSVMVSDQKASFGGSCPAGKCRTYSCWPFRVSPRAVHGRRPVRSLLHHIDGGQGSGTGGPYEDAIAGLAGFHGGAPPVDGRRHGFHHGIHDDLCREKRQHAADNDCLHDVRDGERGEDIGHTWSTTTTSCELQGRVTAVYKYVVGKQAG